MSKKSLIAFRIILSKGVCASVVIPVYNTRGSHYTRLLRWELFCTQSMMMQCLTIHSAHLYKNRFRTMATCWLPPAPQVLFRIPFARTCVSTVCIWTVCSHLACFCFLFLSSTQKSHWAMTPCCRMTTKRKTTTNLAPGEDEDYLRCSFTLECNDDQMSSNLFIFMPVYKSDKAPWLDVTRNTCNWLKKKHATWIDF